MKQVLVVFLLVSSLVSLVCCSAAATTLTVNSRALDGSNAPQFVYYTVPATGMYTVAVSGTYRYDFNSQGRYADAGWSTFDSWATIRPKMDGSPHQDNPGGPFLPTPAGILMLWMNDGTSNFYDWGDYSSSHVYTHTRSFQAGQQLTLWVSDWYPYDPRNYSRPEYQYYFDNEGALSVNIALVPEPSSLLALVPGLGGLVWMARRRKG